MAKLTSLTFLAPSLTIAWALWALEGLYPLALMGFFKDQLYVSMRILVLKPFSLQVFLHVGQDPARYTKAVVFLCALL